jgi:hypothetical protein
MDAELELEVEEGMPAIDSAIAIKDAVRFLCPDAEVTIISNNMRYCRDKYTVRITKPVV